MSNKGQLAITCRLDTFEFRICFELGFGCEIKAELLLANKMTISLIKCASGYLLDAISDVYPDNISLILSNR